MDKSGLSSRVSVRPSPRRYTVASGNAPVRGAARKLLADDGFLSVEESATAQVTVRSFYTGKAHTPGTSFSDDCHRRRLMAVSMANYYLERLDNWVNQTVP